MPGPAKKDPSLRARTNKSPAMTRLRAPRKNASVPKLPAGPRWFPQVRDWWKRAWSSPMAAMWDESDRDAMFLAARLQQQFWDAETSASTRNQTSAQIRSILDQCGLTPMARKRLGWELPDPDADEAPPARREPVKTAAPAQDSDPRKRRFQVVS